MRAMRLVMSLLLCALCVCKSVQLTDENFYKETLLSGKRGNWFIKFYTNWCTQSKKLAPIWIDLTNKNEGKVNFGEVNAMENNELTQRFGVTNYPTLIYIVGNKYVKYEGPNQLDALQEFISETYKYGEKKSIPKAPSALILFLENLGEMIQHQMNTQPLILCAILVAIGICMGVTLGMIAHVVLKEPAVDTKKE
ncbi:hypothetical protein WA577_007157, partial [Blastocystis sp. JDR]